MNPDQTRKRKARNRPAHELNPLSPSISLGDQDDRSSTARPDVAASAPHL
jgi:hypothetical protein